ncbi:hypothetical protein [Paraliomyxa miuraensis]|nr:hypothetical protein [Paraliomyxa miuraensis]MCX4242079.1 hypothetical protein [Paraliomyxa miuraensis]
MRGIWLLSACNERSTSPAVADRIPCGSLLRAQLDCQSEHD